MSGETFLIIMNVFSKIGIRSRKEHYGKKVRKKIPVSISASILRINKCLAKLLLPVCQYESCCFRKWVSSLTRPSFDFSRIKRTSFSSGDFSDPLFFWNCGKPLSLKRNWIDFFRKTLPHFVNTYLVYVLFLDVIDFVDNHKFM